MLSNPNASRSQKSERTSLHDETFSAIAGRTDEREACEQEVSGKKPGHRVRVDPVAIYVS